MPMVMVVGSFARDRHCNSEYIRDICPVILFRILAVYCMSSVELDSCVILVFVLAVYVGVSRE